MKLKILGLDPSLRNWGISIATYDTDTSQLNIIQGDVIHSKHDLYTKQNHKDLHSAKMLIEGLKHHWTDDIDLVCVELPHGSQSSRAMVSYGVCLAVLAGFIDKSKMIYVSPYDVKHVIGEITTSKKEIIQWVTDTHQEYQLPKTLSKAEHIADSITAIHAGLKTKQFKEYLNENFT